MLEAEPVVGQRLVRRPAASRSVCESSNDGPGADDSHVALARPTCFRPPVSVAMTFSLRARMAARSIGGAAKRHAPVGQVPGLGHGLGHVQQGLRGDAAAQQADAAQPRFQIDQGDLHAQVGGQERGGISARPAAEHDQLCVHGVGSGFGRRCRR